MGSYWVFLNDNTQKIDCTFVNNTSHGFSTEIRGQGLMTNNEYFHVFYATSKTVNGYPIDIDRIEGSVIMRNPVEVDNGFYQGQIIYTCFSDPSITIIDSLRVGNFTFYNVQKSLIESTDIYTVKSIGTVKKVIKDSLKYETWNLIRWKIVK